MICPFCGTDVREGFDTCTGCRAVYRHDVAMERSGNYAILQGLLLGVFAGGGLVLVSAILGGIGMLIPLILGLILSLYSLMLPVGFYYKWKAKRRVGFYKPD